jgi:cell division protease FtsH
MSDKIGPIAVGKRNEHVFLGRDFGTDKNYSEEIASIIDREIKSIIEERYEFAKKLLIENKDIIEEIVKVLLEKETLDEKEVEEIIERVRSERSFQAAY